MLHTEQRDGMTVVRMDHGKVNALDIELLDALTGTFTELDRAQPPAVVLTGNGRVFSAGVDLYRVIDDGPAYAAELVGALDRTFRALFSFSRPLVAAVEGAAIAGGCILVCGCDHRIVADGGGPLGITELQVGVPFPVVALELVRFAVGDGALQRLALFADVHSPGDARTLGLVDETVAEADLLPAAVAAASRLAAVPSATFTATKSLLRRPTHERITAARDDVDPLVAEIWASPEATAAITAFAERVMGRR